MIGARNIVEFGTSYGISAIYLGAAARDNGGRFTGADMELGKVKAARENLALAGLGDVADVRAGDAMETLKDLQARSTCCCWTGGKTSIC